MTLERLIEYHRGNLSTYERRQDRELATATPRDTVEALPVGDPARASVRWDDRAELVEHPTDDLRRASKRPKMGMGPRTH